MSKREERGEFVRKRGREKSKNEEIRETEKEMERDEQR